MIFFVRHVSVVFLLCSWSSYGLVPLESLIHGDYSEKVNLESSDPLQYVFDYSDNSDKRYSVDQRKMALYRGIFEEGKNLENFCSVSQESVKYSSLWEREQVKRTVISTAQYIGLDYSIRALASYAREFDFDQEEFSRFTDGLVGNYCSSNITVISKSQLKKLMKKRFLKGTFSLPSIKDSKLFPQSVTSLQTEEMALKKEFSTTVEIFKSFCSWSGGVKDIDLMVPFLKSPLFYSFVVRQLTGTKVSWNPSRKTFLLIDNNKSVQVLCDDLICRRTSIEKFKELFPLSVGGSSIKDDLDRLFCQDFQVSSYNSKAQDPKIREIIRNITYEEQNFLVSQFMSLVTSVPDFILHQDSYDKLKVIFSQSMDFFWDRWAERSIKNLNNDIFYEEPLTVELNNRELFFHPSVPKFKVSFDVNLGEFDRVNQEVGKLKSVINIKFKKSFLKWAKGEWANLLHSDLKEKEHLVKLFKLRVDPVIEKVEKVFLFPLWQGDISNIIINEILTQIGLYRGLFFIRDEGGDVIIPLELNFAPYALSHIRKKRLIVQSKQKKHVRPSKNDLEK